MKRSSIKIVLYTLLTTLLIFSLVKTNYSPKNKIIKPIVSRFLSTKTTEEMLSEMCKHSSSDLENFYKNNGPEYTFTPEGENDYLNKLLMNFANNSKFEVGEDDIIGYSKDNSIYVIIIVLFILLIVLWIPYTFCICRKCCCCIPERCSDNLRIFLFIAIFLSAAIIICCFIGYSQNTDILHGIFGLGCSILKMENHLINGDEYTIEKPYWIGLSNVLTTLISTKEKLEEIGNDYENINNTLEQTKYSFDDFENDLEEEWNKRGVINVSSPIPDKGEINPDYLQKYGPKELNDTCLGLMLIESSTFEDMSTTKMRKIVDVINIKDQLDKIMGNMTDITEELNKTVSKVEETISSGIGDYYDNFDEIDSIVRRIMNALFSLNLAIVIAFAVFIVLLLCCKFGGTFICIFWFFIYIFMLLSFLLGCVLGVVSSFVKDSSSAVKYLMNNTDQITSYDKIDILDTCINGNGSLSHTDIIPSTFNTSIIDDIYYLEKDISNGINFIQEYHLLSAKSNEELYNKVLDNPRNYESSLFSALNDVKLYINAYEDETKVVSPINDYWVVNKEDCNNDYLPNNSLRNLLLAETDSKCLVITEWSEDDLKARYSELVPIDHDINIIDEVIKYYNSISIFLKDNEQLINDIKAQNKVFNNTFERIKVKQIEVLNNITNIITPLRNLFKEYIVDGSIFEIMNCKFIKRDVNKVLEVLYNEFGGTFKTTSNLFLAISIGELALTIMVMFIMKSLKASQTQIPDYSKYSKANQ